MPTCPDERVRYPTCLCTANPVWESEHPLAAAVVTRAEASGVPVVRADRFENVTGHARPGGGSIRRPRESPLVDQEGVALGPLEERRQFLANGGRTAVLIAVDGRAVGVMGLADAPRPTARSQPFQVHGLCRPAVREGWRPTFRWPLSL
jgi:P-type Cu2+ transporter